MYEFLGRRDRHKNVVVEVYDSEEGGNYTDDDNDDDDDADEGDALHGAAEHGKKNGDAKSESTNSVVTSDSRITSDMSGSEQLTGEMVMWSEIP